eukprot:TRINITY_DN14364_c0_g1_i1.p2 TRINITY_DN14364_c0_g1~~TRINITY_DN14364_c0_g1_i1.p2  ORF type:complete len:102 (+),score=1.88 TRINITY_DN14364_c0_g1_i1:223-528(+)
MSFFLEENWQIGITDTFCWVVKNISSSSHDAEHAKGKYSMRQISIWLLSLLFQKAIYCFLHFPNDIILQGEKLVLLNQGTQSIATSDLLTVLLEFFSLQFC